MQDKKQVAGCRLRVSGCGLRNEIQGKVQDGKTVYGEKKQRKRWIPIFMGMTKKEAEIMKLLFL